MPQAQQISQQTGFPTWIDFEFLRKKGLNHIGLFSGDWWTDHNTHDPGITIMEVLCYALTDLGYRTQFDIKNILARPYEQTTDDNFFSPDDILTCNPLTVQDYKKMLLDIEGVRNALLVPIMDCTEFKGLYQVYIDIEEFVKNGSFTKNNLTEQGILTNVINTLQAHRNLGEDFLEVKIMEEQLLNICMDLDLTATAIPEDIIVEVYWKLQEFLTPHITFYTLQKLLEKKTIDEVFEGRPLQKESHGFIDNDELETLEPKDKLHISDLYKVVMGIEGVRAVKQLTVNGEPWCLNLDKTKSPTLNINCFKVNITKGSNLPLYENRIDWAKIRQKLRHRLANSSKVKRNAYELGKALSQEEVLDLADYTSIMEEFPVAYGVGTGHTPLEQETANLKYHAFQLKGYLAFYDQLLVNYLGQLSGARKLFRLYSEKPEIQGASYLTKSLADVMPMADDILRNAHGLDTLGLSLPMATLENKVNSRTERDNIINIFRNAFENDNLLKINIIDALDTCKKVEECKRFSYSISIEGIAHTIKSEDKFKSQNDAERAIEKLKFFGIFERAYSLIDDNFNPDETATYGFNILSNALSYEEYLSEINEKKADSLERREQFLDHLLARFGEQFTEYSLLMYALNGKKKEQQEMIEDKERFLKNYPLTSRNRGKGFDYSNKNELWNTDNTSGFEQRVAGYMGIDDWKRRNLNPFKLVDSSTVYFAQWKDEFDNILFETPRFFDEKQLNENTKKIKELKNIANFKDIDCCIEGFFTFEIVDDCGNILAKHLQRYDSAARYDTMKTYFFQLITEGKIEPTTVETLTYKYKLHNEKGELLLTSSAEFDKEENAANAFYQMLALAVFEQNYCKSESKNKSKSKFYFNVQNADNHIVACSERFDSEEEKDVHQSNTVAFLQKYWLPFEVVQMSKFCVWQMQNTNGEPFVKSNFKFANCDDSAAAYVEAMHLAQHPKNWSVVKDENTSECYLGLWRTDDSQQLFSNWLPSTRLMMGRSIVNFSTENAANNALLQLQENIKNETQFLNILFKNKNTQEFGFQWFMPDDSAVLMRSKQSYKSEAKAIRAYDFALKLFADKDKYKVEKGKDDLFYLEITDYTNNIHVVSEAEFVLEKDAKDAVIFYAEKACQTLTQRDILTQKEGAFYVQIVNQDNNEVVLKSIQLFDNQHDAYNFTLTLSTAISDRNNFEWPKEKLSDETILFGFELKKDKILIAKYPERYTEKDKLTIAKHPEQYAKKEILECIINDMFAFKQPILPTIEKVLHEEVFYQKHTCDFTLVKQKNAPKKLEPELLQESVPQQSEDLSDFANIGSRVRINNSSNLMASYSKFFLSEEDRNDEEKAFVSYWKSSDKVFPKVIDISAKPSFGTNISNAPSDFCSPPKGNKTMNYFAFDFYIKYKTKDAFECTQQVQTPIGKIGLQSVTVFDTNAEALKYGDENMIYFMSLLKDYDTYEILRCQSNTRCFFLQVFDYQSNKDYPILISNQPFTSEKCARIAMKNLIDWANRFPVISQKQDEITVFDFQLLVEAEKIEAIKKPDAGFKDSNHRTWKSIKSYPTWQAAYEEFEEFLRLLDYTPNIFRMTAPFRLALGEILLETLEMPDTWNTLTAHLEHFNRKKNLLIYPTEDCACEILLASDCYRLAFHVYAYDNPTQRTRAWQQWWTKVHCEKWEKPSFIVVKSGKKKNCQVDCSFNFITFQSENKGYRFHFDLSKNWYDLQNYAEFPEFYEIEPYTFLDKNKEKTVYRLTLRDAQNLQIGVFLQNNQSNQDKQDDCFNSLIECQNIIRASILNARQNPIKKGNDGKYFFRIYDVNWKTITGAKASVWNLPESYELDKNLVESTDNQSVVKVEGAYVWQSISHCTTIEKVEIQYKRFCESIAKRENYKYVKEENCGPFSFELIDEKELWGYYPMPIKSTRKAEEIRDKILENINREGFHVVEHILLRDACKTRNACCDVISGIVTIVLPHWSERFQNEQFRQFFQNTILRELPAHLMAQIFWVTPEGMAKFEKVYYEWLYQKDDINSQNLWKNIQNLKDFLPNSALEVQNVNSIFLDQSSIN